MQDPDKLRVTHEARSLAVNVYRATAAFPNEERYGIAAQLRRAAVGIGSNISEGCGRSGNRELLHDLYSAHASTNEVAFQITVAQALDLGSRDQLVALLEQTRQVGSMLNRLTVRVATKLTRKARDRRPPRRCAVE